MKRFVEGEDRRQTTLLPLCIDDYVSEENTVRVIEAFVAKIDLAELGFEGVVPERTGRPAYHPETLLKIYIYGYLNRIPSSRRLEREAPRNLELMWLTGRLAPDFKTIADFRKDNGQAMRATCRRFVLLCRELDLLSEASVAIDSSKFKAINAGKRNYTPNVVRRRMEQTEASVARYLAQLETADRQEDETARLRTERLKDRLARLEERMAHLREMEAAVQAAPDDQVSLTDPDARAMATTGKDTGLVSYNVQAAVDTKHHLIGRARGDEHRQRPCLALDHGGEGRRGDGPRGADGPCRPRLLRRRGCPGVHRGRPHPACAQTDDLGREGRRAVRQARLRLPARGGRLPLSCRRDDEVVVQPRRRERDDAALLLDHQGPGLPAEGQVHAGQVAPHHALGARRRAGRHATAGRRPARRHAPVATDG